MRLSPTRYLLFLLIISAIPGCNKKASADLVIINGNLYTFQWKDPGLDGTIAEDAPHDENGWHPEAQAIAVKGKTIMQIGSNEEIQKLVGDSTKVINAKGGTIIPGLVDSHTHVINLGQNLDLVDLTQAKNEEEAVALVETFAKHVTAGEWIIGKGWDEGAWASHYPDKKLLSEKVPDHPVLMRSLHSYAAWCNQKALDVAGITAGTPSPAGGEIVKDASGQPTGLFLNKGTDIIEDAVPRPDIVRKKAWFLAGLQEMAKAGYVAIHEAGVDSDLIRAIEELDGENKLPIRVYVMLLSDDKKLMNEWQMKGPYISPSGMLTVRSVKAFYDGALGSRGAKLLEDYSDMPGHRGITGTNFRFDPDILTDMANAGFQICVHAIGDAANRETLDFFANLIRENPAVADRRNRIEHSQVVDPKDMPRFAELRVIASMEPSHAVEDMAWAEKRLGPERIEYAYAWRSLRMTGTPLIFNSDLTGTDYNIYYGLHSSITRQNKNMQPEGGWYPSQDMTPEEALRGFTVWPAFAAFEDGETGVLAKGNWADITILTIDPLNVGEKEPGRLFEGQISMTIVKGKIAYAGL